MQELSWDFNKFTLIVTAFAFLSSTKSFVFGTWSQRTWEGGGNSNTEKEEISTRECYQASHRRGTGLHLPRAANESGGLTVPQPCTPHLRGGRGGLEPLAPMAGWPHVAGLCAFWLHVSIKGERVLNQGDACVKLAAAVRTEGAKRCWDSAGGMPKMIGFNCNSFFARIPISIFLDTYAIHGAQFGTK